MSRAEHSREPCPHRILDDIGGAYGMGAVGGGLVHLTKGVWSGPRGGKVSHGFQAARMNSLRLGGSFAVWGGLFSAIDCSLVGIRKKEDPLNAVMAGAATGGILQLRMGMKSAMRSAAFGGVLLAMIEGLGIVISRMASPPPQGGPPAMIQEQFQQQQQLAVEGPQEPQPEGVWSKVTGWLGGGEDDEKPAPPTAPKDLSNDKYAAPAMPDFTSGK
ncbi:unnamed protein product [Pedinophyceae sp. YPF-701]|nr:unnamed protein product [Pedinophyceae sp. YPF-701]